MDDLSHWDFHEVFTPIQVELLVQGIDPIDYDEYGTKKGKVKMSVEEFLQRRPGKGIVFDRMGGDYQKTRDVYTFASIEKGVSDLPWEPLIPSDLLRMKLKHWHIPGMFEDFQNWLASDESSFFYQEFKRMDVHIWLEKAGLSASSKYDFGRGLTSDSTEIELETQQQKRKRKHFLHDVIEHAKTLCLDPDSPNAVWNAMTTLVGNVKYGLYGKTEKGLQYSDGNDNPKEFSLKMLKAYMQGSNLSQKRPRKSV